MRLSITRKVALGFGLLLVLLAVLSVLAVLNGFALVSNSARMFQSHTVLTRLSEISIMTRDVQTGYRGFVITGRDEFLEHYALADGRILRELDDLRGVLAGNAAQSARIGQLRPLVVEQLQHGRDVIELRKRDGMDVAIARIQSGKGKALMDAIRGITDQMLGVERGVLEECRMEAAVVLGRTIVAAALGGIFGLAALGLAMFVLHVDIRERERLENALLVAGDREQRRIGQDIHDGLCQQLAGIGYLAQTLRDNLASVASPYEVAAGRIGQLLVAAVTEARNLSHGLHPVELVENGLMAALHELAGSVEKMFGVPCKFEYSHPILFSGSDAPLHVYRIAQEAVYNAVRHASPTRIVIRLKAKGDMVCLEVCDDGRGFLSSTGGSRGIGLQTMRFRADRLGGRLTLSGAPGKGTSVVCEFPADAAVDGSSAPDEDRDQPDAQQSASSQG